MRRLFTDRSHGNLAMHVGDDPDVVAANRGSLLALTGAAALAWMSQVHGDTVATVRSGDGSPEADALVTNTPGLALGVLVADCVPVLFTDAEAGVVGVAHAGREGVRRGIVDRTLDALVDLGADQARVSVLLGPAVCGACYEVPEALRDLVEAAVPGTAATSRLGTPSLDLRAGLAAHLAGRVAEITVDGACTMEDTNYFSYRREGRTGRFAGLVWLEEPA